VALAACTLVGLKIRSSRRECLRAATELAARAGKRVGLRRVGDTPLAATVERAGPELLLPSVEAEELSPALARKV